MSEPEPFEPLLAFLERLPGMDLPAGRKSIGTGVTDEGRWWVKFSLDTTHPLAWRVVQELGHVLNYLSLDERLPTVFKPVSPPPYLNGGSRVLVVGHRKPGHGLHRGGLRTVAPGSAPEPSDRSRCVGGMMIRKSSRRRRASVGPSVEV